MGDLINDIKKDLLSGVRRKEFKFVLTFPDALKKEEIEIGSAMLPSQGKFYFSKIPIMWVDIDLEKDPLYKENIMTFIKAKGDSSVVVVGVDST